MFRFIPTTPGKFKYHNPVMEVGLFHCHGVRFYSGGSRADVMVNKRWTNIVRLAMLSGTGYADPSLLSIRDDPWFDLVVQPRLVNVQPKTP